MVTTDLLMSGATTKQVSTYCCFLPSPFREKKYSSFFFPLAGQVLHQRTCRTSWSGKSLVSNSKMQFVLLIGGASLSFILLLLLLSNIIYCCCCCRQRCLNTLFPTSDLFQAMDPRGLPTSVSSLGSKPTHRYSR